MGRRTAIAVLQANTNKMRGLRSATCALQRDMRKMKDKQAARNARMAVHVTAESLHHEWDFGGRISPSMVRPMFSSIVALMATVPTLLLYLQDVQPTELGYFVVIVLLASGALMG